MTRCLRGRGKCRSMPPVSADQSSGVKEESVPEWGTYVPGLVARIWLKLLHAMPVCVGCRRLALWLRKPLKAMLKGWVDVEVWGLRLRLRARGNLSEQRLIYMPQFLDRAEREALAEQLNGGGVFLDIGANAGIYSLWVASLGRDNVRVEAFEPDPELCAGLAFNIETNGLDQVRVNESALGREVGVMHLVAGENNKGENRVEAEGESQATGNEVKMTTLKRFLEECEIDRVAAMKIDIEGHELDVLEPFFAEASEDVWPQLLICEVVHDADSRLVSLFEQSGYRLVGKGRLNSIFQRTKGEYGGSAT